MNFFSSIKGRVTLWYVFILAAALCLFSVVSYFILSQNINDSFHLHLNPYYTQVKIKDFVASGATEEDYDFRRVFSIP